MKIIIVDDNKIFLEGLRFFLESKKDYSIVATYADGEEFLNQNDYLECDIVLMDIEMPKVAGIKAAKLALWRARELKIIVITGFRDKAYLNELIGAGCRGCVFKENIYEELETAIAKVMSGEYYYPDYIQILKNY